MARDRSCSSILVAERRSQVRPARPRYGQAISRFQIVGWWLRGPRPGNFPPVSGMARLAKIGARRGPRRGQPCRPRARPSSRLLVGPLLPTAMAKFAAGRVAIVSPHATTVDRPPCLGTTKFVKGIRFLYVYMSCPHFFFTPPDA